ncbi:MAG: SURF1 family cytochrome oxidase biogenesis protein [Gordonia sp. (in: high G+C Gram-positive bacteria)]|uniref:SURF1 family cytochrome oxidase biogenesis protein n=1 Tax=Gordonia sp. (in: high G+C Gram-positive bacteria) TaxID=84139 RepID=UPI003BB74F6E
MRLLRTFLRPGWLLSAVLVAVFAAACFLILAPWQLGKNTETEHRNDLLRSASQTAAVPLDQLVPAGSALATDDEWREVTLTGRYLSDQQVQQRLRSVGGRPAAEIITPFAVAGTDRVILVDRGWIRPGADGAVTVPGAPGEEVTIHARLRRSESTGPGKEPRVEGGLLTAYTIDAAAIGTAANAGYAPFYVQLTNDQPGGLGTIDLPQLESGPYLSYGLQWLAFGIMAPLGVGYFVWAEVKHRRALTKTDDQDGADVARPSERQRIFDELRDVSAPDSAGPRTGPEIGAGTVTESDDASVQAKLAQRYGR